MPGNDQDAPGKHSSFCLTARELIHTARAI